MAQPLVLSLFPGIGLLDMAFEREGFCVVRGPDVLWGGDIKQFHPPAGVFDGVIGGPPCQMFSRLRYVNPLAGQKHGNLIPEFERCVRETHPTWFVMENVPEAPEPVIPSYEIHSQVLDNRWLGEAQQRRRRISFGVYMIGRRLLVDVALFESARYETAITASGGSTVPVALGGSGKPKRTLASAKCGYRSGTYLDHALREQGLPDNFLSEAPFTVSGKIHAVGNGVPLPMGRAIARAVKRAMGYPTEKVAV